MKAPNTKTLLIIGFTLIIFIMATVVMLWFAYTKYTQDQLTLIHNEHTLSRLINMMSDASRHRALLAYRMSVIDDIFEREEEWEKFRELGSTFLLEREKMFSHPAFSKRDRELWQDVGPLITRGGILHNRVVSYLIDEEDDNALELLRGELRYSQDEFIDMFGQILDHKNTEIDTTVNETQKWQKIFLIAIGILGTFGILVSVTVARHVFIQIMKSQNILVEAHKIEQSASINKTRFMRRMSHELRTPLNVILGFIQILQSDENKNLTPEQSLYIEHIANTGWRFLELIDNTLELTKVENEKYNLSTELINPGLLLRECIDSMSDLATKNRVSFHYNLPQGNTTPFYSDHDRLIQIINILLSNGIKFNNKSGTVTISVINKQDDFVHIEVENTGPGIEQKDIEIIFEPFSHIGQDNNGRTGGMSLVLCKELVSTLGGKIGVRSELGVKTVFWIDLPNHPENKQIQ